MDAFLRFRKLPTWQRQDVNTLMKRLNAQEPVRGFFERFVAAPLEKALTQASSDKKLYSGFGSNTIEAARSRSLDGCQKGSPSGQCKVVMENDHWVAGSH
jgi:hypothetical protein